MLFLYVQAADIVQHAVVALTDQRIDGAGLDADIFILLQHILDQGVGGSADAQSVGHDDGGFNGAQLFHLHQTHGLAEAVDDAGRSHNLLLEHVALVGQNGGNAGIDIGTVTDGHMANFHAGNVGNQVASTGSAAANLNAGFFVQTHNFLLTLL